MILDHLGSSCKHFGLRVVNQEIRNTKHETNSNDRNIKSKTKGIHEAFEYAVFEHLIFGFVSAFGPEGFRYSYFGFAYKYGLTTSNNKRSF